MKDESRSQTQPDSPAPMHEQAATGTFVVTNNLYGRERETLKLLESFDRISGGRGEVMLVRGPSGIGKTALVNQIRAPIGERNGFFLTGKFNQYQQNLPYFAFRQALAEFCRELLGTDTRNLVDLKREILGAVGTLGQLLIDFVPDFASILGPQPALEPVSPQEARHRFGRVMRGFLKVVCRPEHPVVLFIDDWQWADAASLELLKQLKVGSSLRYFLLIASYRDDEVVGDHPLLQAINDLRVESVPVTSLQVTRITLQDARQMLADTFLPDVEGIDSLSARLHEKTLGNPFFLRSFLNFLYNASLIRFDDTRRCWRLHGDAKEWDELPDDIVVLFALKLRGLGRDEQQLLSMAACLGSRFDMETLSIVSGSDVERCLSLLGSPRGQRIVQLLDGGGDAGAPPGHARMCAFRHDRLQQAAYMLIDPIDRPKVLLQIGRLLLARLTPQRLANQLFEVANALNAGYDEIHDTGELTALVEVNLAAARKAYEAAAYSAALNFYRAAARVLEKPGFGEHLWDNCHATGIALLKELAGCEFLAGDREQAEEHIHLCVTQSGTALEKAEAYCILILQYTLLARYPEAIAAGRKALAALQIQLPEDDFDTARDREIARVREVLADRTVASLADLPLMVDPEMLMACKILITMGPPCYRSHQKLWSFIVPRVVNLTLRYGNIPQVGYSHTAFGGLLAWVDDDYATAREFGDLATRLMTETFTSSTDQSVFHLMIGSSIRHWTSHLSLGSQDYRHAYETGLRSGNLQYAAYAFGHNMYCQFYQGMPLADLIKESQRSLAFSRTRLNQWAIDLLEGGLGLFDRLSSERLPSDRNEGFSEDEYLARVAAHHNIQVACIYKVIKASSLLIMGDHRKGLELSDEVAPLIYTVGTQGLLPWPEYLFTRFLLLAALYGEEEDAAGQAARNSELAALLERLRAWSRSCPANFEHKLLLASAEMARIGGRAGDAIALYDQAIAAAEAGEFLQWAALANERASRFWTDCGDQRIAHAYWQQAYVGYARWGAVAKLEQMEAALRADLMGRALQKAGSNGAAANPDQATLGAFVEKQVQQVRDYVAEMRQGYLRIEAETQAEELAGATQKLRIEIAERKRTEEALRASERRFRELFLGAPLGIAMIDSLSERIHEVNPKFAQIAGRTMSEMRAVDWMQITHEDDIPRELENMERLKAGEISGFQMEKRCLRPDGTPVWISMTIAPVNDGAAAEPRHLCMIEDINDRKQAEAERRSFQMKLLQTQKLESLGVLAGGIAHDFNNILTGIIGNADLALLKMSGESPAKGNLRAIETAAVRAADLAKQLLAYSGKGRFVIESINMNSLLGEMLHMLKVSISKKAVLRLNTAPAVPVVHADATQMRQVIMNLVINASEAIGDHSGVISISTGRMDCDREYLDSAWVDTEIKEGTYLYLEISDTGCGMTPEIVSKIFDPFFTTKFTGRGLGMSAVLGIVRGHEGAIKIYSEPGRGTTFKLLLPAASEGVAKSSPEEIRDESQGCGNVLLVDDEETVQTTAGKMLEALGYTVTVAANGREALELFKASPDIDLVLMDLTMPHMDGAECFRELRKIRPDIRIIMSSGYNEQEVTQMFAGKGLGGFIQKPYRLSALRDVLKPGP